MNKSAQAKLAAEIIAKGSTSEARLERMGDTQFEVILRLLDYPEGTLVPQQLRYTVVIRGGLRFPVIGGSATIKNKYAKQKMVRVVRVRFTGPDGKVWYGLARFKGIPVPKGRLPSLQKTYHILQGYNNSDSASNWYYFPNQSSYFTARRKPDQTKVDSYTRLS